MNKKAETTLLNQELGSLPRRIIRSLMGPIKIAVLIYCSISMVWQWMLMLIMLS